MAEGLLCFLTVPDVGSVNKAVTVTGFLECSLSGLLRVAFMYIHWAFQSKCHKEVESFL